MATRRKLRKSGKSSRKHQRTFRRKNRVKQRKHSRRRRRVMRGGGISFTEFTKFINEIEQKEFSVEVINFLKIFNNQKIFDYVNTILDNNITTAEATSKTATAKTARAETATAEATAEAATAEAARAQETLRMAEQTAIAEAKAKAIAAEGAARAKAIAEAKAKAIAAEGAARAKAREEAARAKEREEAAGEKARNYVEGKTFDQVKELISSTEQSAIKKLDELQNTLTSNKICSNPPLKSHIIKVIESLKSLYHELPLSDEILEQLFQSVNCHAGQFKSLFIDKINTESAKTLGIDVYSYKIIKRAISNEQSVSDYIQQQHKRLQQQKASMHFMGSSHM